MIKQTIGSHERLRSLAQVDVMELETVEQSLFLRNYRTKLAAHKSNMQMQGTLRESIGNLKDSNQSQIGNKPERNLELVEKPRIVEQGIPEDVQTEINRLKGENKL